MRQLSEKSSAESQGTIGILTKVQILEQRIPKSKVSVWKRCLISREGLNKNTALRYENPVPIYMTTCFCASHYDICIRRYHV
jgi:hypothetical protein